jgi:acetyl esterase/lipase
MQSSTRIELWPNGAPGALGEAESDIPFIDAYLPETGNGAAVLVCPGGGYGMLALDHEGTQVAHWLSERGFAAFVLHYRSAPYKHPIPLKDAQRALRLVRSRAREWKLDDEKIGVWGFSAGGHLAACCATMWDEGQPRSSDAVEAASSRPDFAVLAYPVITMIEDFMHRGSRDNLLGENPDPELARRMSPDHQVNERTPPTFCFTPARTKRFLLRIASASTLLCASTMSLLNFIFMNTARTVSGWRKTTRCYRCGRSACIPG